MRAAARALSGRTERLVSTRADAIEQQHARRWKIVYYLMMCIRLLRSAFILS
jgi:hypothetical protein